MEEAKVSGSKSPVHLDHGVLAVISPALGLATSHGLSVISVAQTPNDGHAAHHSQAWASLSCS